MTAVYNEIDGHTVDWLRNLERADQIAAGTVDHRSIHQLVAADVRDRDQFHAFAGIGIWSAAIRSAGWPDDCPIWTGSCPCQPFAEAGVVRPAGVDDPRHLWPEWFRLIRECLPPAIVGEQVASKDGLGWLDLVFADLEAAGYACAAIDWCAAGIGAPHRRQRLYFVALRPGPELDAVRSKLVASARALGDTGRHGDREHAGELRRDETQHGERSPYRRHASELAGAAHATSGFWRDADWLWCRDGRWRPVRSGSQPLAPRTATGVAELRAYGNGIVRPQAAAFLEIVRDLILESEPE